MRAVEAAGGAEALGPELTFRLHRQRVIELACAGDSSGALEYAAEHLAPAAALDASGALLESLESAVSLVAFDDPRSSPMAELAGDAERRGVADALNAHMLRREGRGGADSAMQGLLRQIAYAEEKIKTSGAPTLEATSGVVVDREGRSVVKPYPAGATPFAEGAAAADEE
mmetsp:Transcript_6875/g.28133  ORF Transcript_6875/g.28133 Transcript_6875/m.28133 type:complete len:171 (-) Transcript_6875:1368-1880(-)